MSQAVRIRVYNDLITTLNSVRISGGAEVDATAEGESVRGNTPENDYFTLIDNGDTPADDSPVNADDFNASFTVLCFVAASDTEAQQPYPPELIQLVAEARRVLNDDYTRGGNAINTITGADTPSSSPRDGCFCRALDVTVHYRTNKDDPTSYGD